MKNKTTTVNGVQYKIVDESYEDDYGSLVSNYVTYKKEAEEWARISPNNYILGIWDAEDYIPREVHSCPTCGHKKRGLVNWD